MQANNIFFHTGRPYCAKGRFWAKSAIPGQPAYHELPVDISGIPQYVIEPDRNYMM